MQLDELLTAWGEGHSIVGGYPGLPTTPEGAIGRFNAARTEASRRALGIVSVPAVEVEPIRWTLPADADGTPPGYELRIPVTGSRRLQPSHVVPGSAAATAAPGTFLHGLIAKGGGVVRYTGVAVVRAADGGWLLVGEGGAGKNGQDHWTHLVSCPHGLPGGLYVDGGAVHVQAVTQTAKGPLHWLVLRNAGPRPVNVQARRPEPNHPPFLARGATTEKLGGITLVPGAEVMWPVTPQVGDRFISIQVGDPATGAVAVAPLVVVPVAGHPGHTHACQGAAPFPVTYAAPPSR